MFNFTTLTVYNKIKPITLGNTPETRRVSRDNNLIKGYTGDKPFVRIGNTRFDADNIESLEVKAPSKENLAEVTFDLTPIVEKANEEYAPNEITARIALYIGLSMNSQDSFYANDFVYKGKPLYIEFYAKKGESVDIIAKRVKAIADKYLLFTVPLRMLDVIPVANPAVGADPGPAADAVGTITFKAIDGYQLIKKAELQWYNPEAKTVDCCTKDGDYEVLVQGVPAIYEINTQAPVADDDPEIGDVVLVKDNNKFLKVGEDGKAVALVDDKEVPIYPGLEAFGDYNWLIHNLRLPTAANYYPWSVANQAGEMPIPGQQYTQFIVKMGAVRDGIAGGVVGQRAISVTTHVFYAAGDINTSGTAAYEINDALTSLISGISVTKKTTADTSLTTPFAGLPQ